MEAHRLSLAFLVLLRTRVPQLGADRAPDASQTSGLSPPTRWSRSRIGAEERAALGRGERARLRGSLLRTWAAWRAGESSCRPPTATSEPRARPARHLRARQRATAPSMPEVWAGSDPTTARRRPPPLSSTTSRPRVALRRPRRVILAWHDRKAQPRATLPEASARTAAATRSSPSSTGDLALRELAPPSRSDGGVLFLAHLTACAPSRCSTPRAPREARERFARSFGAPGRLYHSTTGSGSAQFARLRSSAPDSVPSAVFFFSAGSAGLQPGSSSPARPPFFSGERGKQRRISSRAGARAPAEPE